MRWTEENIEKEVFKVMKDLNINRMPTSREIIDSYGYKLYSAIWKNGGIEKWANKLGLEVKKTFELSDENIEKEIREAMQALDINRMPTTKELRENGFKNLDRRISRTRKYSGWADKLGLETKSNRTVRKRVYKDTSINPNEYAVYRGDEFLFIDTPANCARRLGVSMNAFAFYKSRQHRERVKEDGIHVVCVGKEGDYEQDSKEFNEQLMQKQRNRLKGVAL
ncbi:hypothetical protein [Virgibacillus salexigens]|uniref:Uncharacterized protein n=1 Tax=Virgibacillus kapii TaxID=1638645 RepID=A0ABQ2D7L4_9BACI|nr:hypothetical protein [Virgibacillus kapii]GGJ48793.1 hypothetical protein GCM10007111_08500 [Virgibacillus kapii]